MAYWPDRLTPAIIGDSKRDPGDGSNRRNKQPCVGQAILALKPSQARQKRAGLEAIPSRLGGFISYVNLVPIGTVLMMTVVAVIVAVPVVPVE